MPAQVPYRAGGRDGLATDHAAQRHVDHHRRSHSGKPLEELGRRPAPAFEAEKTASELTRVGKCGDGASRAARLRIGCCLRLIIWMGESCLQIAGVLHVHEATGEPEAEACVRGVHKRS